MGMVWADLAVWAPTLVGRALGFGDFSTDLRTLCCFYIGVCISFHFLARPNDQKCVLLYVMESASLYFLPLKTV